MSINRVLSNTVNMASSDDERLIKNSLLFISLRENKNVEEKIENVLKYLTDGADIDAVDGNNNNNSPIHIAVRRSEARIVRLLIDNGANTNPRNSKGETPLSIALELNTDNKQEIVDLLQPIDLLQPVEQPAKIKPTLKNPNPQKKAQAGFNYLKRTGTSGVCGQLYETKLLSLVLMRALNDEDIKQFHLGTNINGIGDLDDICLRYEVKGHPNPIMLFVQAKHREDREKGRITVEDIRSPTGDFSLRKYFDSYLTIIDRFQPKNKDIMFDGEFNNVECNLIIYTPAKDYFAEDKKKNDKEVSKKIHYLINTSTETEAFQYKHDEDDIEFLTKMTVLERIKKLGSTFLDLIMAEGDKSEVMMTGKLMARYHVVLGRQVLQVSRTNVEGQKHRMWQFNPDFFTSCSEYLTTLKETFYRELSTRRCDKSAFVKEDVLNVQLIIDDPCAFTISKVIGKLATYDDKSKKLQLIEIKNFKEKTSLQKQLSEIEINEKDITEAIRIKLESMDLKMPLSFGNLDMTVRGNDNEAKVKKRLETVAVKFIDQFKENKVTKIVEISDEHVGPGKTLEQGIIDINGGIGSAVGNLLVLDPETNLMKFDLENKALPKKATLFLNALKVEYESRKDLVKHEFGNFRIKININGFPKDSFHGDEYDKRQARDFLNRLWFYANQAKEDEVESILKADINKYYNNEDGQNKFKFRIHSDAIFLRSHDEIQKWWMKTGETPYLSRSNELFESAKLAVIDNPLLTVLNFMYNLKIQNIGIKFHQDAIDALELDKTTERLYNVVTEANVFSGIKIMQHFENEDNYTFIDLDYVLSLPLNDYNTMLQELKQTNIETLIIIYEKLKFYEGLCNKLKQIIKLFKGSKVVIVTDSILADELQDYIGDAYRSVRDGRTYLVDLNDLSQKQVLESSMIMFQGEELPLKSISYQTARNLVRTEILTKLVYGEKIEIGQTLTDEIYKNVKDHFIDRSISKDGDTTEVNTLDDINDYVVVISGTPGMGKSALLTHLSLNTKLINSLPWIVRVNLPDYEKEFTRWQDEEITITVPLVMYFICTIALKNIDSQMKIELENFEGQITISHVEANIDPLALFELELFLYLCNSGKVIFLFDDFDAMCPHYEKEVINILKLLKELSIRMWIMTCSYKHTRIALENEFGITYKLKPFQAEEKRVFLNRFFQTNLRLERLNYHQFENVRSFLEFMSKFTNSRLNNDPDRELVPLFSLTVHLVYVLAVKFFQSEINRASPSTFRNRMRENFQIDFDQYTPVDELLGRTPDDEELELSGTPLHLYLIANYFKFRLEDSITVLLSEEEAKNKWDVILNTFTTYQHYVEAHMKRIFFKEDSDDQSVVSTYQETRKEFLQKHKKLGLFTLCRENDLDKFFKPAEISEIHDTISRIHSGEDRSTLVDCVVNEVPRFAHLIFAEYFAVECLTDMMKAVSSENDYNPLKNAPIWKSIMNMLLFKAPPGVRKAFDYKLQSDSTLSKLANSEACKQVVFELLLKQEARVTELPAEGQISNTPIVDAIEHGFKNIVNLFLSSAQQHLNRGNINEFLILLKRSGENFKDFGKEYAETIINVLDSVKDMDIGKLAEIIKSGRLTEVPLRHASSYCQSETASELQRRVLETTEQLPELTQQVQQLFQHTDSIGHSLTNVAELAIKTFLDQMLTRIKPPELK